jgi:hypothetical protein
MPDTRSNECRLIAVAILALSVIPLPAALLQLFEVWLRLSQFGL